MHHSPVTLWTAVSSIISLVIVCLVGQLTVRRWMRFNELALHHEITDPLLQVVGMMFAILLGFMVGDAMQRFSQARSIVQQEAASVADIYRLSEGFQTQQRDKIRFLCTLYVDQVVSLEWPLLEQHKTSNAAWKTYHELWSTLSTLKVTDDSEASVLQTVLPCMVSVGDNRRMRVEAMHTGLPPVLWMVLGIAGLSTVVFTFFFGAANTKLQLIMTAIIAIVIGLNVFMLASYNDPFSGDVMIHPDAFEIDQKLFKMTSTNDNRFEPEGLLHSLMLRRTAQKLLQNGHSHRAMAQ